MALKTHVYGHEVASAPASHVYGLKYLGFGSVLNLTALIMIVVALAVTLIAIKYRHLIPAMFASSITAVRSIAKGRAPA